LGEALRTRGFASPDYSGFAFFGDIFLLCIFLLFNLSEIEFELLSAHKKAPILQPKMSAQDCLRDISSAARPSNFVELHWIRGFASPDYSDFALFGDCC
jgi:hypothetical protein